jgi:hypothetical protein
MDLRASLGRILKERRLFIRWATAAFATTFATVVGVLLEARGGLLIWIVLVSLGAGWLMAYYMWHLNYAAAHAWGPLVQQNPEGEKERDV